MRVHKNRLSNVVAWAAVALLCLAVGSQAWATCIDSSCPAVGDGGCGNTVSHFTACCTFGSGISSGCCQYTYNVDVCGHGADVWSLGGTPFVGDWCEANTNSCVNSD